MNRRDMWLSAAAEGMAALARLVDQQSRLAALILESNATLARIEKLLAPAVEAYLGPALEVHPLPPRDWAPGEIAATIRAGDLEAQKALDTTKNPPVQCSPDTNPEGDHGHVGSGNRFSGSGRSSLVDGE